MGDIAQGALCLRKPGTMDPSPRLQDSGPNSNGSRDDDGGGGGESAWNGLARALG